MVFVYNSYSFVFHLRFHHFEIKVRKLIFLHHQVRCACKGEYYLCLLMSWMYTNIALTYYLIFKTDPANLDYEIISGARRQEKRFKAEENGTVIPDEKVG